MRPYFAAGHFVVEADLIYAENTTEDRWHALKENFRLVLEVGRGEIQEHLELGQAHTLSDESPVQALVEARPAFAGGDAPSLASAERSEVPLITAFPEVLASQCSELRGPEGVANILTFEVVPGVIVYESMADMCLALIKQLGLVEGRVHFGTALVIQRGCRVVRSGGRIRGTITARRRSSSSSTRGRECR